MVDPATCDGRTCQLGDSRANSFAYNIALVMTSGERQAGRSGNRAAEPCERHAIGDFRDCGTDHQTRRVGRGDCRIRGRTRFGA